MYRPLSIQKWETIACQSHPVDNSYFSPQLSHLLLISWVSTACSVQRESDGLWRSRARSAGQCRASQPTSRGALSTDVMPVIGNCQAPARVTGERAPIHSRIARPHAPARNLLIHHHLFCACASCQRRNWDWQAESGWPRVHSICPLRPPVKTPSETALWRKCDVESRA